MRTKEKANDYRYFTDPDLPAFHVTDAFLNSVKKTIPALPEALITKYTTQLNLPEYDARVICDDKETVDYFEELIKTSHNYKAAANWLLGPVKSFLNEKNISVGEFSIPPRKLSELIQLVEDGKTNFSIASSRIFPELVMHPGKDPLSIATDMNLLQSSDTDEVALWVQQALAKMPDKVEEYKKGKKGLIGLFVGEVKKISKGKADPKLTNRLLLEKLES